VGGGGLAEGWSLAVGVIDGGCDGGGQVLLATATTFVGSRCCRGCREAAKEGDILMSCDVTYRDARCVSGGDTDVIQ
jgi:hypothetical protein